MILFIAGIHGVGKTTCSAAAANTLRMSHVSASQLIRTQRAAALSDRSKIVDDVAGNQELLLSALRERRRAGQRLLLDGHMTLQTRMGIDLLGVDVFRGIAPNAIVMLRDTPELIRARLLERDGVAEEVSAIDFHQHQEGRHAAFVAGELRIPFRTLNTPTAERLAAEIVSLGMS